VPVREGYNLLLGSEVLKANRLSDSVLLCWFDGPLKPGHGKGSFVALKISKVACFK